MATQIAMQWIDIQGMLLRWLQAWVFGSWHPLACLAVGTGLARAAYARVSTRSSVVDAHGENTWLPLRGRWAGYLLAAILVVLGTWLGTVGGARGLSYFTDAAYAMMDRDAQKDGQYAMVFLWTISYGAILGATLGAGLSLLCVRSRKLAVCVLTAGALFTLAMMGVESAERDGLESLLGFAELPGMGAPLVWAVLVLFTAGLISLRVYLPGWRAKRSRRKAATTPAQPA